MNKKRVMIIISFFLLGIIAPLTYADVPSPIETFKTIWEWISSIFTFEWALSHSDDTFGAFMRLVIWIILFTVLYAVGSTKLKPLFGTNKRAGIVAGLLSILGVIFIPLDILVAIAETYSTVGAFALLAVPCGGLIYLVYETRRLGWTPRARAVLNLALIFLLWVIIHIVTTAVEGGL